jgi:hypothetical protein
MAQGLTQEQNKIAFASLIVAASQDLTLSQRNHRT